MTYPDCPVCGRPLDYMGEHLEGGGCNCGICGAVLTGAQYIALKHGTPIPREEVRVRPPRNKVFWTTRPRIVLDESEDEPN